MSKDGIVTDTVKRTAKGQAEPWGVTLMVDGEIVDPYERDPSLLDDPAPGA